jgi:sulfide dehydrogenase cytochrome subunit
MKNGLCSMLLMLAGAAQAQDVRDAPGLQAASLAASCTGCHGTQGRAVAGSAVPGLAGQPASVIAEQLKAFKSGARTGTVMPQIAKGYSDAQIDRLAAYFAAQKK